MKILRFGLSDDSYGDLPLEQRSWHISQQQLAEASGAPWETVLEDGRPASSLPGLVERRVAEVQPEMVVFCCPAFWVSYPSAPLLVLRSRIPFAKTVARAGFWAASKPAVANRAIFHAGRRVAAAGATTAFFFEPEQALSRYEEAFRAVLRHEHTAIAVRGPLPLRIHAKKALREVCEGRRATLDAGLAAICSKLHIEYRGFGGGATHPDEELLGDRIHVNAAGHARRAIDESEVMVRAWRALSGNQ